MSDYPSIPKVLSLKPDKRKLVQSRRFESGSIFKRQGKDISKGVRFDLVLVVFLSYLGVWIGLSCYT